MKFSAVSPCRFEFFGSTMVAEIKVSDHLHNVNQYYLLLGKDEKERHARYVFESDRIRLVITWGILRLFLAEYKPDVCSDLRFRRNKWGKPELESKDGVSPVNFSISHSSDRIMYAFSEECPLGIDIEKVCTIEDRDVLVQRFFSDRDQEIFFQTQEKDRTRMFFRMWSMKEAVLKAEGMGLSMGMSRFSVDPLSNGEVVFRAPYMKLNGKMKVVEPGGDLDYARALCQKIEP